jgi:hypothetical protein
LSPNVHRNGTSYLSFLFLLFVFLFISYITGWEWAFQRSQPLWKFLSSRDIISFLFKGSFCKKAHILSSSGKTCQDSTLSGKWGWYNDINVQSGLSGSNCLVGLAAKTTSLSTIEFISLLIWVMLKDRRLEINFQTACVYLFSNLLDGV